MEFTMSNNKKIQSKSKKIFIVLIVFILAMCAVIAVILIKKTTDNPPTPGLLEVGHYINVSGDTSHYIEVYDDGTLRIFGLDYVGWSMENNHNGSFDNENAQNFAQKFHDAMSSRNSYIRYLDNNTITVTTQDEFSYAIKIVDEFTLMLADSDELVYIRSA